MTTSQNTPPSAQGRHRTASTNDRPAVPTAPGPQQRPNYPQPTGQFRGQAQRPGQIPAQWGATNQPQSGPAQHYPGQPHPAQPYPTPSYPAEFFPAYPQPAPQGPAPRNGLGIAAFCLGIFGMLFGLIPFTGFVAFALGAIGIILGLVGFARSRKRIATNKKTSLAGAILSTIAVALGIWGMVIVFTGLSQLSEDLSQIPTPSTSVSPNGTTLPADVTTPATTGPTTYQLEVTGTAKKMMVAYGTGSATSSASDYQSLPWRKTVETTDDFSFANVTATSSGPGSITCTITDTATGAVVSTKTSESLDNSQYSSATVSCSSMG